MLDCFAMFTSLLTRLPRFFLSTKSPKNKYLFSRDGSISSRRRFMDTLYNSEMNLLYLLTEFVLLMFSGFALDYFGLQGDPCSVPDLFI